MPNHNCCVSACKSRNKRDDVKFIKFPAEPELANKWKFVIGREPGFKVTKNTRICSLHFVSGRRSYESNCIDYIPSIFPFTTVSQIQFTPFTKNNVQSHITAFFNSGGCGSGAGQIEELIESKKRKLFQIQSPPANVECEPDIYTADNGFIPHYPSNQTSLKSEECQTELRNHEIEKLYSTNTRLLNEIQQLKIQIAHLKSKHNVTNTKSINNGKCVEFEAKEYNGPETNTNGNPKLNLNIVFSEVVKSFDAIGNKWRFVNRDNSIRAIRSSNGAEPVEQQSLEWDEYGHLKISVHNRDLPSGHSIWKKVVQSLNVDDIVPCILQTVILVAQYRVCSGNFEQSYQTVVQSEFDCDDGGNIVGYRELDFKEMVDDVHIKSTLRSRTCNLLIDRQIMKCKYCFVYSTQLNKR